MTLDEHRRFAFRVVLAEVDSHLGVYLTQTKQLKTLARLIRKNDLREDTTPKGVAGPATNKPLTAERLAAVFKVMARQHPRQDGAPNAGNTIWSMGSAQIHQNYLAKIGYRPRVARRGKASKSGEQTSAGDVKPVTEASGNPETNGEPTEARVESATTEPTGAEQAREEDMNRTFEDEPQEDGEASTRRGDRRTAAPSDPSRPDVQLTQKVTKVPSGQPSAAPGVAPHVVRDPTEPAHKKQKTAGARTSEGVMPAPTEQVPTVLRKDTAIAASRGRVPSPLEHPAAAEQSEWTELAERVGVYNPDQVKKQMRAIWLATESAAHEVLKASLEQAPAWVTSPNLELAELYRQLFGKNYLGQMLETSKYNVHASDVLQGCFAAAVFNLVLKQPLPWEGPKDMVEANRKWAKEMGDVLRLAGCNLTHEQLLWQAGQRVIDTQISSGKLHYVANELAQKTLLVLDRQLALFGSASHSVNTSLLAEPLFEALVLKGKMRSGPHYFDVENGWIGSGVAFDDKTMEEVGRNFGDRVVLWCLTPLVRFRATATDPWLVAARARVIARTRKADGT